MTVKQYEVVEESLYETSDVIIDTLRQLDDECATQHISTICNIKDSFKTPIEKSKEQDILKGMLEFYDFIVYRGNKKAPRESGKLAYQYFLFSLHMAAIKTDNIVIKACCYGIEKSLYNMPDTDILIGLGMNEEKRVEPVAKKVYRIYYLFIFVCMTCTVFTFIMGLFTKNEVDYFAVFLLILMLGVVFILLKFRNKLNNIDHDLGVNQLSKENQDMLNDYILGSLKQEE